MAITEWLLQAFRFQEILYLSDREQTKSDCLSNNKNKKTNKTKKKCYWELSTV